MIADTLATVRRLRSSRGNGKAAAAGGFRVLRTPQRVAAIAAAPTCRSPCAWTEGQGRDRRDRRGRVDTHRIHRRRLRREPPSNGSRAPRSPRSDSPRLAPERPPSSRGLVGGAPHPRPQPQTATTGSRPCSTPGASTRSSPPPTWTPSPPTRPTAATRSSSRCTPTSKTLPGSSTLGTIHANAAWLVLAVIAFNLTRAAPPHRHALAKCRTATIRRTLVTCRHGSHPRRDA